jgi:glutathione S-transferase
MYESIRYFAVHHYYKPTAAEFVEDYHLATKAKMTRAWHTFTMLTILGKSSSINVRKVLWTCAEIGLPYQLEQYGSGLLPVTSPEFLRLNPNGMVPVIIDDGRSLWESNTICRYLAGKHGRTDLLPAEAMARALVEKWMDWQATELNNSWRYAFMALVRQSPAHADPAALAASTAEWNRLMAMLDAQLSDGGAYVCGATLTLADIVLGLSLNRWLSAPMRRPALPALAAYFERLSERPGFLTHGRNGLP